MKTSDINIIRSKRRSVSIRVTDDGSVEVRAPKKLSDTRINELIIKNQRWIEKKLKDNKAYESKLKDYQFSKEELNKLKKKARNTLKQRTKEISESIGIDYKKFRLSGARKRWGSCSSKKTVSINWKLIFTPPEVIDYVITHELAHIKHMNHSKRFWKLLEQHTPDYKKHRKWLNKNDYLLRVGERD